MELELLLSHADDGTPVMHQGLSPSDASSAPEPEGSTGHEEFGYDSADPDSLPDQRWGLVVPQGAAGDRLLEIAAPLIKAREEQQGARAVVYRAAPGITGEAASRWWSDVYHAEDVHPSDVPRYLLMLGGAEQLSWDLQHRLASDTFIGRLSFSSEEGYEAYIHKLLSWEKRTPESGARALFHTVRDGSPATKVGYQGLMTPALSQSREARQKGQFGAGLILELGGDEGDRPFTPGDLIAAAGHGPPTMLFSVSNGCGAPRGGWKSAVEQRRVQGAMIFDKKERLTADDVATGPFLPGGAWFYFACFGAGTPSASAYYPWLSRLREMGVYSGDLGSVLQSLPDRAPPFVSALSQAALENPDGPLVVMGHVDLAWTFSFQEAGAAGRYRTSRFFDILRALVEGKRSGAAYFKLQRFFNQASVDLAEMYHQDARMRARSSPEEDRARQLRKAFLWMLRQDLGAYVLLGDPAARLNVDPKAGLKMPAPRPSDADRAADIPKSVRGNKPFDSGRPPETAQAPATAKAADAMLPPAFRSPSIAARPIGSATVDDDEFSTVVSAARPSQIKTAAERIEAAVFPQLGDEALTALAAHFGMTRAELDRWIETYRKGGRRAVEGAPGDTPEKAT